MKIYQLFETGTDYSSIIADVEQTPEFKEFSKRFTLTSTPIQRRNGSFQVEVPIKLHTGTISTRLYFANIKGDIRTKYKGGGIWQDVAGVPYRTNIDANYYIEVMKQIELLFDNLQAKKLKKKKNNFCGEGLTSLEDIDFTGLTRLLVRMNKLTSLKGIPKRKFKEIKASANELVSPLLGAPEYVEEFNVDGNKLTTFEGFPKYMTTCMCYENNINSYKDISKHILSCKSLFIDNKDIGLLGLLKVNDLNYIYCRGANQNLKKAILIVMKHLPTKDILACHEELVDNGLEEYAQF